MVWQLWKRTKKMSKKICSQNKTYFLRFTACQSKIPLCKQKVLGRSKWTFLKMSNFIDLPRFFSQIFQNFYKKSPLLYFKVFIIFYYKS